MKVRLFAALVLSASCSGRIGDGPGMLDLAAPSPDAGTVAERPPKPAPACTPEPGPAPMRRLTGFEYDNTVRDLFAGIAVPMQRFPGDTIVGGFENNAGVQSASPLLVEQYQRSAVAIAEAVRPQLDRLVPCRSAGVDMAACGRRFLESWGPRTFRRPLTLEERDRYLAFFEAQRAELGFDNAVLLTIEALLLSPEFLYRLEIAEGTGPVRLSTWELASRLSYLLWGSMPDTRLFQAAAEGRLSTPEQLEVEARRMLMDPRARKQIVDFHRQWLAFDRLDAQQKDAAAHPSWNEDLKQSMRGEAERFVEHTVFDGEGTLRALLTSRRTYVDARLASLYGVAAPAKDWDPVDLDPRERAGILTQAAFLASHAHAVEPSPVLRGVFVLERLLCDPPPPPPPELDTTPPRPSATAPRTNRERYSAHVNQASCAACHVRIDGAGYGLEGYDAIGRFRTEDNGVAVDAKSRLAGTDVDGAFEGGVELAERLAASDQVQRCAVTSWFRFAYGRTETPSDACTIDRLDHQFGQAGQDVREMLVAFVKSEAFLTRRVDP